MDNQSLSKNKWLIYLFLLIWIVPVHLIGIDKVVTVDEPWWVISGANYYYALTHDDFENTIYDYHPAVTTTWVVTGGILAYFPEYRGFGQGYFDVRKSDFEEFLRIHGKEALDLVRYSRWIQTGLITGLALMSFFLLQNLVDKKAAFLAIALTVNAPFFLGHSRLLNHEGLLALFVLVSILGMQVYLYKGRKLIYMVISGAAFGLAQLTKSPSIVVAVVIGLMFVVDLFKNNGTSWKAKIFPMIRAGFLWLLIAALVYVVLWPGMWVAPGKMLSEIYGNAFSYAFQGSRLQLAEEIQPRSFDLASSFAGMSRYVGRWVASSTWISWLGLVFALLALGRNNKNLEGEPVQATALYLGVIAFLFIALFGVAEGRDSAHYILSSFVCLDVIAGIGWVYFFQGAKNSWSRLDGVGVQILALSLLLVVQLGSVLPYYPYYFTYKNLFAHTPSTYGYGEGLEQAALYLAQKPNAQETQVYAYAGLGPFSFFYPGPTETLKKIYFYGELTSLANGMKGADYLVLYSVVQNSLPNYGELSQALQDVQPEKVFLIYGVEYVRIYKIADIPESVIEEMR